MRGITIATLALALALALAGCSAIIDSDQDVGGGGVLPIDYEVGVPGRDLSAAQLQPLAACCVDQPAGRIARRILEDAARALLLERLAVPLTL